MKFWFLTLRENHSSFCGSVTDFGDAIGSEK